MVVAVRLAQPVSGKGRLGHTWERIAMTTSPGNRPIEVLLVEDDPADARLTMETLKGSEHRVNGEVPNGNQGLRSD